MTEGRGLPSGGGMTSTARLHGNNVGRGFACGDAAVMTVGATQGHGTVTHLQWHPANTSGMADVALLGSRNMCCCLACSGGAVMATTTT